MVAKERFLIYLAVKVIVLLEHVRILCYQSDLLTSY